MAQTEAFFFFSHKPLESQHLEPDGKNGPYDFYEQDSCSITLSSNTETHKKVFICRWIFTFLNMTTDEGFLTDNGIR